MQDIIDDKPADVSKSILYHDEGVNLLPSNIELSGLEVRLINAIGRESVLKTCVNEVMTEGSALKPLLRLFQSVQLFLVEETA